MKHALLAGTALLIAMTSAHAAPRERDPFTDGSRADAAQVAVRAEPSVLIEEQFRTLAVRKTDPYTDGAVRRPDPFQDGASRPVDPFVDGALAKLGPVDAFSDGA